MFTPKFIKNIIFNGETVRALGRSGNPTRVLAVQGNLDGSCAVYSLMMLLIFHQKLDWEDLIDRKRGKDNAFVYSIQRKFLYHHRGLCKGGHMISELSDKLNLCIGKKISETFTIFPNRTNSVSRRELHQIIKAQLDARKPVLLCFQRKEGTGHALVSIGYRREGWNRLRLFCLDPVRKIPFMSLWNNVIDLDYLSNDDMAITDFNYYEEEKVCITKIMIIHDDPLCSSEPVCPF
jgi:hypothetical protein